MKQNAKDRPSTKLIWLCVVAYRWLALFHILIMLLLKATTTVPLHTGWLLFSLAIVYSITITMMRETIFGNESCWLPFLAIDLIICFILQSFGGGWRSAWYLYSYSPILVAAFFFQMRGALITAAISSILYSISVLVNGRSLFQHLMIHNPDDIISNLFSYFLIAIFFAYPCLLFERLVKTRRELAKAHRELASSERQLALLYEASPLTRREIEVLKLLAESKSNREIAEELYISEETVKSHVKNIFRKLDVKSRTEAASYFWQLD